MGRLEHRPYIPSCPAGATNVCRELNLRLSTGSALRSLSGPVEEDVGGRHAWCRH